MYISFPTVFTLTIVSQMTLRNTQRYNVGHIFNKSLVIIYNIFDRDINPYRVFFIILLLILKFFLQMFLATKELKVVKIVHKKRKQICKQN
jgi:hypothetical protein